MVEAWTGLLAYTIQIYFDFAGYSNMAIGLGVILGFSFPRNFRLPYTALSITEFWRRWHISLSSWLRDYLYIPLGGSRVGPLRTYRNLLTVFLLCGVWHGANWTFVVWGAWHGELLVTERLGLGALLARVSAPVRWLYALLAVMGGWVLFRASNLSEALQFYASLIGWDGLSNVSFDLHEKLSAQVIAALIAGCVLAVAPRLGSQPFVGVEIEAGVGCDRHLCVVDSVMTSVAAGTYSPFIYFRF